MPILRGWQWVNLCRTTRIEWGRGPRGKSGWSFRRCAGMGGGQAQTLGENPQLASQHPTLTLLPLPVSSGRPSYGLWQGSTAAPLSGGRRVVWQSPWSFDTHTSSQGVLTAKTRAWHVYGWGQRRGGLICSMRGFHSYGSPAGPFGSAGPRPAGRPLQARAGPSRLPRPRLAAASERTQTPRGGSWASPEVARGASTPTPLALTRHVATPTARNSGNWGWPGAREGGRAVFAADSSGALTEAARSPLPETAGPGFQPATRKEPGGLGPPPALLRGPAS